MRFKLSARLINRCRYHSTESVGLSNNRSLNVCLFGHHQSGKTLLCSSMTKLLSKINSTQFVPVDVLDSNEDEKKLGSTINLSFASIHTGNTKVSLIDCPGRDNYISSKIKGLTAAHLGILVVSGDQPRSAILETVHREMAFAKHFNLKNIVIYLSKSDLLKNVDLESTKESLMKSLKQSGHQSPLILSGSSLCQFTNNSSGESEVNQLISYIDNFPIPFHDSQSSLYMQIIQAKTLSRSDAYILGYLEKGFLEIGQNVTVIGKGREFDLNISKIAGSPPEFEKIKAGSLCELILRGNRCKWVSKGMVITSPGSYYANDHFDCLIKSFPTNDCLKENIDDPNFPLLSLFTDQVTSNCLVENLDYSENETIYKCSIKLSHALILHKGCPFALAKDKKLIGLGNVNEIFPNLSADDKLSMHKERGRS